MSVTETTILQDLLAKLGGQQVSALHLRPGSQPVVRRDGELQTMTDEQVVTPDLIEASLGLVLTPAERQTLEQERQVTVGYTFANRLRLRVTVFYQRGLPELAIRFIPQTPKAPAELGLPQVLVDYVTRSVHGLVLVAGPFGSGRSTTLASLVGHLNQTQARHVVTIEDPIEYVLASATGIVDQRQVGSDVLNWQEAVDGLPQEDCDVVVLGKLPSASVTQRAVDLALAGKLVLVAVETDSTVKAVEQLVGGFLPDAQEAIRQRLGDALLLATSQKLVPRIGGGRVLVCEVLVGTPAVKAAIREGRYFQAQNLLQTSREEGMVAFDRALAQLVKTGEVLREEAERNAQDLDTLQSYLRR